MTLVNAKRKDEAHFSTPVTIDRSPPQVKEVYVFRKAEWKWIGDQAAPIGVEIVPETWTKPHASLVGRGVLALIACPNCRQKCALVRGVHTVQDHNGKVSPSFQCASGCGFHRTVYLDKWNDKPLYCVAYEERHVDGTWHPKLEYCHATNAVEARRHIGGHPEAMRIVGIAPCVGYNVADEHGDKLYT